MLRGEVKWVLKGGWNGFRGGNDVGVEGGGEVGVERSEMGFEKGEMGFERGGKWVLKGVVK